MAKNQVLYVYKCADCGHQSEERRDGHGHDGAEFTCGFCGAGVSLEWDGGVTLEWATHQSCRQVAGTGKRRSQGRSATREHLG